MHSNSGPARIAYCPKYLPLAGNTGTALVTVATALAEMRKPA